MLLYSLLVVVVSSQLSHAVLYDGYTGLQATEEQIAFYTQFGVLSTCTVDVKPCDKDEIRRVDGTCNNLNDPARGTNNVPQLRLLPANYFNGSFPRKSNTGEDLTAPRLVRLQMLKEGKGLHEHFNHFVPGFGIFLFTDVGSPHDTTNMLFSRNYCCQKDRMNDYGCTPTIIRDDDPVHRYSNVRCMNSTRPLTFQEFLCTKDPVPSPFAKGSPAKDLSNIYNSANIGSDVLRTMSGGQLATEIEDGKTWPPNGPVSGCPLNQPGETRCFKNFPNTLIPVTLLIVWFVRFHNYIASELAAVNPGWDDDTLFYKAREINIAVSQQIYIYEWLVALEGEKNLQKEKVINKGWFDREYGFREDYDQKAYPLLTMEYTYALRWFHLFQEESLKMYDTKGVFLRDEPMLNLTFRSGYLAKENNMEYATQSMFRQPCHKGDHSVVFDVAERGLPIVQNSLDIVAGDISKGRYFGMPPYVDYVALFHKRNIKKFEDLSALMDQEQIDLLKEIYSDVSEIDFMAGMWAEKLMEGGKIPYTLACILNDDTIRARRGDRHWYESSKRPHAFTKDQLYEIRKVTLALLLCTVGDGVTEVQRKAFFNISPENPLVSCSEFEKINFKRWLDPKAQKAL